MDANMMVTPSFVPLTPFGAMAAEKRSLLDKIKDIADKVTGVADVVNAPVGSVVTVSQPNAFPFPNFNANSIFGNPLFIAGAAVVAVMLLRKKGRR